MEALNFVTAHLSTILSIGELDEVTATVGLNDGNGYQLRVGFHCQVASEVILLRYSLVHWSQVT